MAFIHQGAPVELPAGRSNGEQIKPHCLLRATISRLAALGQGVATKSTSIRQGSLYDLNILHYHVYL